MQEIEQVCSVLSFTAVPFVLHLALLFLPLQGRLSKMQI